MMLLSASNDHRWEEPCLWPFACSIPTPVYAVTGESNAGGDAGVQARQSCIVLDGSAQSGEMLPGPADFLCAALSACILKNLERFSHTQEFHAQSASVRVEAIREEPPLHIVLERFHKSFPKFGAITYTRSAACDVQGEIVAEPSTTRRL